MVPSPSPSARHRLAIAALILVLLAGLGLAGLAGRGPLEGETSGTWLLPWPGDPAWPCVQGNRSAFTHQGMHAGAWDFLMPTDSPVAAMRAGQVVLIEEGFQGPGLHRANRVEIDHPDGTRSVYAHLRRGGAAVEVGQEVAAGELIGWSGMTGRALYPHLHVQVLRGEEAVPLAFADLEAPGGVPRLGRRARRRTR